MEGRSLRRIAGMLSARLSEAKLGKVGDPRRGRPKWRLEAMLRAVLVGITAGCRSLQELEVLGREVSVAMRQTLGLPRKLADTTLRDLLCQLPFGELRKALHRLVRAAARRKALDPVDLPFGVLSMDGKVTALPAWNDEYVQKHKPDEGAPYGLMRTVTSSLVSAAGKPCIDVSPIPVDTNEMGHFGTAFLAVLKLFGWLFKVVTYDAGVLSHENAILVVKSGKHFLFNLKGELRIMYKLASELLDPADVEATTEDVIDNSTVVTRSLVKMRCNQNWAYGNGKSPEDSIWPEVRTFLRVESVTIKNGIKAPPEVRLYVSSLEEDELTPEQWLKLIRSHWGVETTHQVLDIAFQEDDHPWIVTDGTGMLAVLVLRRIAYTMLALFRSVTSRGDKARAMPWKELLKRVMVAVVATAEDQLLGLRERQVDAVRA